MRKRRGWGGQGCDTREETWRCSEQTACSCFRALSVPRNCYLNTRTYVRYEKSQRGVGLEGSSSFGVKEMAKVPGADDGRTDGAWERGKEGGRDVGAECAHDSRG